MQWVTLPLKHPVVLETGKEYTLAIDAVDFFPKVLL